MIVKTAVINEDIYLQGIVQYSFSQVLEHTVLGIENISGGAEHIYAPSDPHTKLPHAGCNDCTNPFPGADLVSVSPPLLLRHVQAPAVSREAAVGPVGVVEAERAPGLRVTWVLDGDGARRHGDDTVAACFPLSLREEEEKIKEVGGLRLSITFNNLLSMGEEWVKK